MDSQFDLHVRASDNSKQPLHSNVFLLIKQRKSRQRKPFFFSPRQVISVRENSPKGTFVALVSAKVRATKRTNDRSGLEYFLSGGNEGGKFSLNSTSGRNVFILIKRRWDIISKQSFQTVWSLIRSCLRFNQWAPKPNFIPVQARTMPSNGGERTVKWTKCHKITLVNRKYFIHNSHIRKQNFCRPFATCTSLIGKRIDWTET